MRRRHSLLAVSLTALLTDCAASRNGSPTAEPAQELALAEVTDPMASFARLVPGEWWVTFQNSASQFDTWHWGPGQHSIREVNHGADGVGNVWSQVVYWHPGRKQVCLLVVGAYARGVFEGTMQFDGEDATGVFDMIQTSGLRKMGLRWDFDGPDTYHDTLLDTGPNGLEPTNRWERVRSKPLSAPRTSAGPAASQPSERLAAFAPLLGRTWEATVTRAAGDELDIETSLELVPGVDALCARIVARTAHGEPRHLLDVYVYHHTGAGVVRCLALSDQGGVYEGDVSVLDGGALQMDLKGYEGDRVVQHVVRFDFEDAGTLRQRVGSVAGTDRTLVLDVHHERRGPEKD